MLQDSVASIFACIRVNWSASDCQRLPATASDSDAYWDANGSPYALVTADFRFPQASEFASTRGHQVPNVSSILTTAISLECHGEVTLWCVRRGQ